MRKGVRRFNLVCGYAVAGSVLAGIGAGCRATSTTSNADTSSAQTGQPATQIISFADAAGFAVSDGTKIQFLNPGVSLVSHGGFTDQDGSTTSGFGAGTLPSPAMMTVDKNGLSYLPWAPGNPSFPAGLTGYWNFEDYASVANGTSLASVVGPSGVVANVGASVVSYVPGKVGHALQFDGQGGGVTLADTLITDVTKPFTIGAWVKPTGPEFGHFFYNGWGGIGLGFASYNITGLFENEYWLSPGVVPDPYLEWQHLVMRFQNGKTDFYENGLHVGTFPTDTSTLGTPGTWIHNVGYIGGIAGGRSFAGLVDELAVFSAGLTDDDILNWSKANYLNEAPAKFQSRIYDSGQTTSNWASLGWTAPFPFGKPLPDGAASETTAAYPLVSAGLMSGNVGLWHFDENSLGTAPAAADFADSSGSGFHARATASLGAGTGTSGHFGVPGQFGSGLRAPESAVLAGAVIAKGSSYSKAAWVRLPAAAYLGGNNIASSCNSDVFGAPYGELSASHNGNLAAVHDSQTLPADTWTQVGVTYDGSSHVLTLYRNGQAVDMAGFVPPENGGALYLGSLCDTNTIYAGNFGGTLDEVGIWNRVLSGDEMMNLYQRAGSSVRFQVRDCRNADCSDSPVWQGPDGTSASYFSDELNHAAGPLALRFSDYPALHLANARYFQYQAIFGSTDFHSAILPALRSVSIGPQTYEASAPYVQSTAATPGLEFSRWDSISETVHSPLGCAAGVRYIFSIDAGSTWYSYRSGAWQIVASPAADTGNLATALTASALAQFSDQVLQGQPHTITFRAYLPSDGNQACALDSIQFGGVR